MIETNLSISLHQKSGDSQPLSELPTGRRLTQTARLHPDRVQQKPTARCATDVRECFHNVPFRCSVVLGVCTFCYSMDVAFYGLAVTLVQLPATYNCRVFVRELETTTKS